VNVLPDREPVPDIASPSHTGRNAGWKSSGMLDAAELR
jgi:hypothetical protein